MHLPGHRTLEAFSTSPGPPLSSQLLYLSHLQFHPRRPAEDGDRDLEPRAPVVDFLHYAVERGERPLGYPHLLTHLEGDRRLGPLDALLDLVHDARGLGVRD